MAQEIMKKIWLSSPHLGATEFGYVKEAFDTNWIAPLGPFVDLFEEKLAAVTGVPHVAVLSSGTAAIHMALILAGVKRDDIVLCQSFTFSASANPILYLGAAPVFVDSEAETWNMCPDVLEEAIKKYIAQGKKPKAIIPVHLYGMPAKMNDIVGIAKKYEITIIEDAAEALGSSYNGRSCGSFGTFGVLSFNGNKIITTSSGGALLSKNDDAIRKARFLATQARDKAPHYQHSHIGYNYRMSNVLAAIGVGQLDVLNQRVESRRQNFNNYREALSDIAGISFLDEPEGAFSNRWLTTIIVDEELTAGITAEDIRLALEKENIESRPLWKPMHLQPVFHEAAFFGSGICEKFFQRGLCLPSGSNLNQSDFERILLVFEKLFK